jgi:hypothetical protein
VKKSGKVFDVVIQSFRAVTGESHEQSHMVKRQVFYTLRP